jgi:hypothetical protein
MAEIKKNRITVFTGIAGCFVSYSFGKDRIYSIKENPFRFNGIGIIALISKMC